MGCRSIAILFDERELNYLIASVLHFLSVVKGSCFLDGQVSVFALVLFDKLLADVVVLSGVSLEWILAGIFGQIDQFVIEPVNSASAVKVSNHVLPGVVVFLSKKGFDIAEDDQPLPGSAETNVDSVSI